MRYNTEWWVHQHNGQSDWLSIVTHSSQLVCLQQAYRWQVYNCAVIPHPILFELHRYSDTILPMRMSALSTYISQWYHICIFLMYYWQKWATWGTNNCLLLYKVYSNYRWQCNVLGNMITNWNCHAKQSFLQLQNIITKRQNSLCRWHHKRHENQTNCTTVACYVTLCSQSDLHITRSIYCTSIVLVVG